MRFGLTALMLIFAATLARAQEMNTPPAGPTSHRSNGDDMFWLSVNGGFDPLGQSLAPVEFRTDATARVQFNRWIGVLVNYHDGWVDTNPRHGTATAHNSAIGLGVASEVLKIGPHSRFWHGAYLLARAQLQYAKSKYHFSAYSYSQDKTVELGQDTQTRTGFEAGADLFVPVYFGLWVNVGVGLEATNFAYPSPVEPGGDTLSLPNTLPYLRLGLAYSF